MKKSTTKENVLEGQSNLLSQKSSGLDVSMEDCDSEKLQVENVIWNGFNLNQTNTHTKKQTSKPNKSEKNHDLFYPEKSILMI